GWELATAVAGAIIGINPCDQPDVEASKVATRALTDHYEKAGALPPESPLRVGDPAWETTLKAHLATIRAGDYAAFLAYIPMNETHEAELQAVRLAVRDRFRGATCVGFGPRYLHWVARIPACSSRSPATTPTISRCRAGDTRLAW